MKFNIGEILIYLNPDYICECEYIGSINHEFVTVRLNPNSISSKLKLVNISRLKRKIEYNISLL